MTTLARAVVSRWCSPWSWILGCPLTGRRNRSGPIHSRLARRSRIARDSPAEERDPCRVRPNSLWPPRLVPREPASMKRVSQKGSRDVIGRGAAVHGADRFGWWPIRHADARLGRPLGNLPSDGVPSQSTKAARPRLDQIREGTRSVSHADRGGFASSRYTSLMRVTICSRENSSATRVWPAWPKRLQRAGSDSSP